MIEYLRILAACLSGVNLKMNEWRKGVYRVEPG
jgi:hypothetical protein